MKLNKNPLKHGFLFIHNAILDDSMLIMFYTEFSFICKLKKKIGNDVFFLNSNFIKLLLLIDFPVPSLHVYLSYMCMFTDLRLEIEKLIFVGIV